MEQSTSSMFLGPVFVQRVFWSVLQRHCRSSAHLWAPESLDVCRHQVLCLAARPDGSAAPGGQRLIENSSVTVWRKLVWWRIVHFLCVSVCVCALHLLPLCVQLVPSLQHLSLQRHPPLFLLLLLSPPRLFLLPLSPPLLHLGFDCSLEEETGGGITATILWYLKSIPPLLSSPPPPLTCCSSCLSLLLSLSSIWAGSSRAVMVLRWLDEKHKRTTQNIY